MTYLYAVLIGGSICALVQLLFELKLSFPVIAFAFVVLGGVLTPTGVMDILSALSAGGPNVTAVGCGNGACSAGTALVNGSLLPLILAAGLNIILALMGALCGSALVKEKLSVSQHGSSSGI